MKKKMPAGSQWFQVAAAGLLLCAAPLAAQASYLDVGFDTTGSASWGGSCGSSCTELDVTGTTQLTGLDGYFGSATTPTFTFSALLDLTQYGPLGATAVGSQPSGGWKLWDGSGDSLYGWTIGAFLGTNGSSVRPDGLYYGVTGGTGVFGSASGFGGSLGDFWPGTGAYDQSGDLWVSGLGSPSPASVPEPGTLGLFAAALVGLVWAVRRRLPALNPIR